MRTDGHWSLPRRFVVPEPADFRTLLNRLSDENVKFIIVGGMAMVSHGSAFLTVDLELCYERSGANLEALVKALLPLHLISEERRRTFRFSSTH